MPTRLYLVRHAIAAERTRGTPDAARPLTPAGRDRFVRAARGLARLGVRFDHLLHSPKLRAVETAEILASLVDGETAVTANLASVPSAELFEEIQGEHVALVGHRPYLNTLAGWLVTGSRERGTNFPMRKGGVIVLEGEIRAGGMQLVEALSPKVMRRIRKR